MAQLSPSPRPIPQLLDLQQSESSRVEFKATWDRYIRDAVVKTVCAFANDLLNWNGGYIVLGIAEAEGQPVLPPQGLGKLSPAQIQKELFEACKAIRPDYQPQMFLESYEDRPLLVLFCPGGDNRPYQAPKPGGGPHAYWVRQGSVTHEAQGDTLRQLLEQTNRIPFDDRRFFGVGPEVLSPALVHQHLVAAGSHLAKTKIAEVDVYRRLNLLSPVNSHYEVRNVALLFFHPEPQHYFPSAYMDFADLQNGRDSPEVLRRRIEGPLPMQHQQCLQLLNTSTGLLVVRQESDPHARHIQAYPDVALREALVNALFHRGYDHPQPIEVLLELDCLRITSFPGPHPRLRPEHFAPGGLIPRIPARNRHIGDLFKEQHLAESLGTGFLRIEDSLREHGSPRFEVDFDESAFTIILPAHPDWVISRAEAQFTMGRILHALRTVQSAQRRSPSNQELTRWLIECGLQAHKDEVAHEALKTYQQHAGETADPELAFVLLCGLLKRHSDGGGLPSLEKLARDAAAQEPAYAAFGRSLVEQIVSSPKADYRMLIAVADIAESQGDLGLAFLALQRALTLPGTWEDQDLEFDVGFAVLAFVRAADRLAPTVPPAAAEQLYAECMVFLESAIDAQQHFHEQELVDFREIREGSPLVALHNRLAKVQQQLGFPAAALRKTREAASSWRQLHRWPPME